jgi:radical SAM protein with 4Fe4S-binding SPASM domain
MIKYTELHKTNRHNLLEVLPLQKPFTVLIEPSGLCNFRCVQCFQSLKEKSYFSETKANMPLDRFRRVLDQLASWSGPKIKVLKLTIYGEPLVSPDFPEMARLAVASGVAERVEMTTNGSLLKPAISEQLVAAGLDYIRVSIYGATQEKHEAVTGSRTHLEAIRDNLAALQEIKRRMLSEHPFVSCKTLDTFSADNEVFLDLFKPVADEVYLDKPHGWIRVKEKDFIEGYYGEDAARAKEDLLTNSTRRTACPMPFTTMAVRANGDVSPCCVDFIGGTNLGNVDQTSLQDLWESEEWYQFQRMHLENRMRENPSCARCDIYRSNHYTKDTVDGFPVERLLRASVSEPIIGAG